MGLGIVAIGLETKKTLLIVFGTDHDSVNTTLIPSMGATGRTHQ